MKKEKPSRISKSLLLLLLTLIMLASISSCNLLKSVGKKDNKTEQSKVETVIRARAGDTVRFSVPQIKFKDTTIYTVNKQGTTLRTVFSETGDISEIECMSSIINEMRQTQNMLLEIVKEKEKDEGVETNINWNWVILGGFVIVAVFLYKKL